MAEAAVGVYGGQERTSEHDSDAAAVLEVDDVVEGSEPGASRFSMLISADSCDNMAKFADSGFSDTACSGRGLSHGTIEQLIDDTECSRPADSNSKQTVVVDDGSCLKNERLKPPQPIFARIDTPTSLSEEEVERLRSSSSAPAFNRPPDDASDQISEAINGTHLSTSPDSPDSADWISSEWRQHKRHVFILSFAGKPIYSRHGDEERQATLMGAMHALVSFVQHAGSSDDGSGKTDFLRSISAGSHRFVFMTREHLILVAASSLHTSTHALQLALNYTYNLIISILTYRRMDTIFSARKNYDLRRLLGGVDQFLDSLLDAVETDPCYYLGAVRCLPLDSGMRDLIAQTIAQHAKVKDLVFAILVANGQLITLVRLKKCFLHPVDLHMVFNLITASDSFKYAESWTPVCLPKFDSSGYLHAHISYLDDSCQTCLLLLAVDKDLFFTLFECKDKIKEKLLRCGCCKAISDSLSRRNYVMSDVGIADMWHFIYKSRSTSQLTSPDYGPPYSQAEEQARLFTVYQWVHNRMHSPARPLKILFHVGKYESVLGWITSGFELYAIFSPLASKQVAIAGVNRLLRWIKKEEDRLFIINSLTI